MFSEATKARFQERSEANMPQLAAIKVFGTVREEGGVTKEGYTDGPSGIPCRISSPPNLRTAENLVGGKETVTIPWLLILPLSNPATSTLKETDRVVVTDPDKGWEKTLEVKGEAGPRTNEIERKVFCMEVR